MRMDPARRWRKGFNLLSLGLGGAGIIGVRTARDTALRDETAAPGGRGSVGARHGNGVPCEGRAATSGSDL